MSDTGHGINESDRERVFEPFFSTKPQGQGLGLSVVYGIVTRLGGRVSVEPNPGGGTRVALRFPAANGAALPAASVAHSEQAVASHPTRKARVLFVDDEEMNIESCRECLEFEGHEVRTATSGSEALAALDQGTFDIVITDLSMPGLSGWDVARAVKQRSPKTPVMLLSGWSVQQAEADAHAAGVDLVMPKPIGMEELLNSVQRLLAA